MTAPTNSSTTPVSRLQAEHRARMAAKAAAAPTAPVDRSLDQFTVAMPGDTRCPVCTGPMRAERDVCSNICWRRQRTTTA